MSSFPADPPVSPPPRVVPHALGPHLRYLAYVLRHKWFVWQAGRHTGAPRWRLLVHDASKFSRAEWGAYVARFHTTPQDAEHKRRIRRAFDAAWAHHQAANAHHWEHWVDVGPDGGRTPRAMPEAVVREMVADWAGAGRGITGTWDVACWYAANAARLCLHPSTRQLAEHVVATVSHRLGRHSVPQPSPAVSGRPGVP